MSLTLSLVMEMKTAMEAPRAAPCLWVRRPNECPLAVLTSQTHWCVCVMSFQTRMTLSWTTAPVDSFATRLDGTSALCYQTGTQVVNPATTRRCGASNPSTTTSARLWQQTYNVGTPPFTSAAPSLLVCRQSTPIRICLSSVCSLCCTETVRVSFQRIF